MEQKTIKTKLFEFQGEVEKIKKDADNLFFKSKYATLNQILDVVKPMLKKLNILITQPCSGGEVKTILTCMDSGTEQISSITIPDGLNAQQIGSAVTYFRRYTLSSLLCLEIDDDDDGNVASKKTEPQTQASADKPKIETWLTEEQFNVAMKGTKKEIIATLGVFNGLNGKGMKKEYNTKLSAQLSIAPTEQN